MHDAILKLEADFADAIVRSDVQALDGLLADDWIIVDPDGGIIDKARFLGVIESGLLTHEMMEATDVRVHIHGDTAVVVALTTTRGKFSGLPFTTTERAADVFVRQGDQWRCVFSQLTRFAQKE